MLNIDLYNLNQTESVTLPTGFATVPIEHIEDIFLLKTLRISFHDKISFCSDGLSQDTRRYIGCTDETEYPFLAKEIEPKRRVRRESSPLSLFSQKIFS